MALGRGLGELLGEVESAYESSTRSSKSGVLKIDVSKIKAPLLLHYAELDTKVNEGWPAYEAALKANNKVYTAYMYPKVNHG